jgi:tetratricopeptide (TPR) repeat protein
MARSVNFGAATLAKAASGHRFPSWELTRAYVVACGGDLDEWRATWEDAALRLRTDGETADERRPEAAVAGNPLPFQLAPDVPDFTGRTAELGKLLSLLSPEATREAGATTVIAAICGTAGIGKSSLAVHFAHQVAHRFPDGQLYVNLRGFDPSDAPLSAAEALHGFLGALGTAPDLMPVDVQAVSALFRSLLAGKRMLLFLDNALDSEQVRPLLPATPGCLVIVTSRSQLIGLVARDGARPLTLDVLTPDEAIALLAARIGRWRVDTEPAAAADLTGLCAGLPLAVVIVAARAASRPGTPLAALADELRRGHSLLDALVTGDVATDVRAVFSWSYEQLPEPAARMFRLLGLHPGPDIAAPTAASLAGAQVTEAHKLLEELTRVNLLIDRVPGRFTFHDLLRAYAADLAYASDSDDPRDAFGRLLDYYLSATSAAMDLLHPAEARRRPPVPRAVAPTACLDSPQAALAWLDAERTCLVAISSHAAAHGWPQQAVWLSATVERYLEGGHYLEGLTIHGHARDAARQAGDHGGEASALCALSALLWRLGSREEATDHAGRALALYRSTGNRLGQARCLLILGSLQADKGCSSYAVTDLEQALDLFRRVGDRVGESAALNNLADTLQRSGGTRQAIEYLYQALALSHQEGDRNVEAHVLQTLGEVEQRSGQHEPAAEYYRQALAVFKRIGHLRGETWVLASLGTTLNHLGRPEQAATYHREAVMLSRKAGDRNGEAVALNGLGEDAHAVGQAAEAICHHTSALALARGTEDLEQQARASIGLGHAHETLGQVTAAREHFQHAFELYVGLGYPEAERIHAKLADLKLATPTAGSWSVTRSPNR